MALITLFLLSAALVALGLGIVVYANNNHRKVNQAYLAASVLMLMWLLSNIYILYTHTAEAAAFRISLASALAACIPTTFQVLRLAIKHQNKRWGFILKSCRTHILVNLLIIAVCFLPSFTKSVAFPVAEDGVSLATPEYGLPFGIFNIYFLSAIFYLGYTLYSDRKVLTGVQRIELEFLGFACSIGLIVGLICGTVFSVFVKTAAPVPIAHAGSVLALSGIVAYGISVHKILAVAAILRRIIAYSLLTCYLTVVYLLSWFSLSFILKELDLFSALPVHIACTMLVVFSMSPVRKQIELAAYKLVSIRSTDIPSVIKASGEIFRSVTTSQALLSQFADLLLDFFSTQSVEILIQRDGAFETAYSTGDAAEQAFSAASALPELINKNREPVCRDNLARLRPTRQNISAIQQLDEADMNIAIGVFSKTELTSVVLLSPRAGGRIYDKNEQDALQILCNQFAVAMENARLYTEMQDSKIRNEIMLDQLVSGVIVADPERKVALINHEAQRITGLSEEEALGRDISLLPESIAQALETTLNTQCGIHNTDESLFTDKEGQTVYVRLGSAYLFGHDRKAMGALLVFTDMTEIKGLEEQVRRADQLSSVGTLAAGMAHEIKNPLVTIKTFTQLLPDRYSDADFRKDFSSLVGHEVARIDGIVNHLLNFSKPTQPHLAPMRLHQTVEKTLELIHEQLSQKNIALYNNLKAKEDLISGDADLLTQTLVNFNLNAIEAIGSDGKINVSSSNCSYRFARGDDPGDAVTRRCIRLQISDTGKGIERDDLQKIFDPFFTSKSEGTGMGLSVAHGIIHEHSGAIEVDSKPGRGTTFNIYLPILREDAAA
jgi:PAS domain S-box-containing protein